MKIVNLATFVVVIFFACAVNWIILQLFPWPHVSREVLDQMLEAAIQWEKAHPPVTITRPGFEYWRDDIRSMVSTYHVGGAVIAYLVSGLCGMIALRYGEKQLFARQANLNWNLAIPFWLVWLVPLGYLVAMSAAHVDINEYQFALGVNSLMIIFLGTYALAYQAVGAFNSQKKRQGTT